MPPHHLMSPDTPARSSRLLLCMLCALIAGCGEKPNPYQPPMPQVPAGASQQADR